MSAKWFLGFYLFFLDLESLIKRRVRSNQFPLIFANNSRSKQNKKNPKQPFVDIGK